MLQFAHIQFVYALAAIPVLMLIYWLALRSRSKSIRMFAEVPLFRKLTPGSSLSKKNLKFILALFGLLFIIGAVIDPEIGSHEETVERRGSDIIIALDVSNSMNARDIAPSRLERSKQAIEKMIGELHGDRIGIVVFAGQPFIQLPITTDYSAAKMLLEPINTGMLPVQGTAIGSAIDMSVKMLTDQPDNAQGRNKTIILITDGENWEDDALRAAKDAAGQGIVIHTIGMGSPEGAPIPVLANGQDAGYMKDKDGNTIITKLNIDLLTQIADATGGICLRASNSDTGLERILDRIRKMGKKLISSKVYRDYDEQFELFIIPALLILILDIFISERKTKWYQRLNLFGKQNDAP